MPSVEIRTLYIVLLKFKFPKNDMKAAEYLSKLFQRCKLSYPLTESTVKDWLKDEIMRDIIDIT